ncbi:MAG: PLDc_N domain-containing protein [Cyclobacteriaceae bacterium]|nr:PLDc_N domain-containing protein [Cyclobacteriaceae bacterium]UYN87536.1 MAG: PLDc_N domain-containing protein [Cyclobacteriaceae bacterium]
MGRIWVLLIFVIDVLAILDVWKREYSMEKRLLWTVVIILLPLIGPIAWYIVSRRIINL